MTPTYVLIHGSNANSFTWAPLQRELALRGHRSLAVDLPGHGFEAGFPESFHSQDAAALAKAPSNMSGKTFAETVERVAEDVRRAREHGPVIAVAHSRGGLTLTALANRHPELLDRIVYFSAWCCVDRTPGEYMQLPEYQEGSVLEETMGVLAADPAELGAIRMNWRTTDPGLLAALKKSMFEDGTDDEFLIFLNSLQPDEALDGGGPDDRAEAETWGRVDRTYIRLAKDASIPVALQDLFISEADTLVPDNKFDVRTLEAAHIEPLVRPARLAELLADL